MKLANYKYLYYVPTSWKCVVGTLLVIWFVKHEEGSDLYIKRFESICGINVQGYGATIKTMDYLNILV